MNDGNFGNFGLYPLPVAEFRLSKDDTLTFSLYKLPNRFHRFMMRLLLGWVITPIKPSTRQLLNG